MRKSGCERDKPNVIQSDTLSLGSVPMQMREVKGWGEAHVFLNSSHCHSVILDPRASNALGPFVSQGSNRRAQQTLRQAAEAMRMRHTVSLPGAGH